MTTSSPRHAEIHRMVMPDHVCPYGLKALHLLKRRGLEVEDHWLRTREETDALKRRLGVETTPQVFVAGERIGGYDDLRRHFGLSVPAADAVSYRPVIALFAVALLMAVAASWGAGSGWAPVRIAEWFVAFGMCLLAMLKLQDIESFSTMFLNYDLLARRFVPYAYFYPFGELAAGVLMAADAWTWLSVPVALFIGGVGAVSVFKAVYIDRRQLKCACVGGNSRVPLGFVSLTENLMMVAMAIWMAVRHAD